jgi:TetR/AcrR family transcriptional regulator, cholesterol catabolism regulator
MSTELSRRERKKEETKERIFKEAIRLFTKRGFANTTIDDITERADVAKGTFFNYFPRKEAVLGYLSEQRLEEVEADAETIFSSPRSAREKLIEIYLRAASAYEGDRDLSRYVVNELMSRAFDVTEEHHHGERWDALIHRALTLGRDSGELRADLDVNRASEVLTGVYYATVYMWVNCGDLVHSHDFSLAEEMRTRLEMVLDGVVARSGGRS